MKMEEFQKKEEELKNQEKIVVQEIPKIYTNSLGMEFVLIQAGEFMMGAVPQDKNADESEKPQHRVHITKPFYLGKYPVTQEEWENLMGNNPSYFKNAGKRAPVEQVTWNDCQDFIKKLNQKEGKTYRLPREAEWEYAARGSTGKVGELSRTTPSGNSIYTFGDDVSNLEDYAWYDENSNDTTHPVGEKKPNSWGLYDMMGNVWEWCEDWYDAEYYKNSPVDDPKGSEEGGNRSLRGGSWISGGGDSRLSNRGSFNPAYRIITGGFRLVLLPLMLST